jgi:cell division septation protein DedD
MEEQHGNLKDIIIQEKPSGLKKLLLGAATLLLLLIAMILITKSLVQSDMKQPNSIILPPKPVITAQQPLQEPNFEQVPIEEESDKKRKIEEVISRLKEDASKTKEPEKRDAVSVLEKDEEPAQHPIAQEYPKKEPSQPSSLPTPKEEMITSSKPLQKHRATSNAFYIQVGAFFQSTPSEEFLNSIRKAGFNYIILRMNRNGSPYQKVLVGPYASRSEALNNLPLARKKINPSAYITQKR